ncbi:MAG: hypothetical protein OES25_10560 [Acidobacteriota bacterium]|nr:hypothetical protein [Acidobacteriota bacterium]
MRVLEQSMHGGLGLGKLGVVIARHGVGKTAFLVGVALDDLMRGKNVLHVTLDQPLEKVVAFYDDIFQDLAHSQELEDVWQARLDCERNRRIQCSRAVNFSPAKLKEIVNFWKETDNFEPTAIILEGFPFASSSDEDLAKLREIASEFHCELWMSAVTTRSAERNSRGVPEPIARLEGSVDVILTMAHDGNAVHVGLHKDHENTDVSELKLALDPTTMLLMAETTPG